MTSATLASYLRHHARCHGEALALVCDGVALSYAQLFRLVERRAGQFGPQRCIVNKAEQSPAYIIDYLAAQWADKVFVPLEQSVSDEKSHKVECLVEGNDIPDNIANILFTTGTTGRPKGVMISHRAILANAENLITSQGYTSGTTFVISGPLNHIGSLSKIWPVIMAGGTMVITEGLKDMNSFFSALCKVPSGMATFLVPAALRLMMHYGRDVLEQLVSKMDFIETGAAPLAQSDMEALCRILPHTRLYNTYASTETGIISTHDYQHDGCIAGCVGRAMKNAAFRITAQGRIVCSGGTLMSGYVGNDALNNEILRDGQLYTSDNGFIDDCGRLCLRGRCDDMINVGGLKVAPSEVEEAAMRYAAISECICISCPHPVMGSVLKLIYVIKEGSNFSRQQLIAILKQYLEAYKVPSLYAQSNRIERTFNGKLNRKFYAPHD